MNYPGSGKILELINNAEKILISCHWAPDPDSVASVLALGYVLDRMGKSSKLITPSRTPTNVEYMRGFADIEIVDPEKFNYSEFDLLILPDIGDWNMVYGYKRVNLGDITVVDIDHHQDNKKIGTVNLVDIQASSASEVLYLMFKDWKVEIDEALAELLLSGIVGDTGAFEWSSAKARTLKIGGELMEKGADKNKIVYSLFRSFTFDTLKFWGDILDKMQVDTDNKFVWSAVEYDIYKKYKKLEKAKSLAASFFARVVQDTDFGIIMVETSPSHLSVSLRERSGFDVSKIAEALGGGGHKAASATEIEGLPFNEAVEKVLKAAREFSKNG